MITPLQLVMGWHIDGDVSDAQYANYLIATAGFSELQRLATGLEENKGAVDQLLLLQGLIPATWDGVRAQTIELWCNAYVAVGETAESVTLVNWLREMFGIRGLSETAGK